MKDNLPGNICDVDKFWARIKKVYKSREIIADFRQIGAGIGILCYDPENTRIFDKIQQVMMNG
jgi:hypothetical protein